MEVETVTNYLANSIVLDGVRAEEIKKALAADVNEELLHARNLGERIKQLGGSVPGSLKLTRAQEALQPPSDTTDVTAVIDGVLSAENAAIDQYYRVIRLCEGVDYVTQELAIRLVADEEMHRTLFEGFLKEYRKPF
jgi:bacterioferritin